MDDNGQGGMPNPGGDQGGTQMPNPTPTPEPTTPEPAAPAPEAPSEGGMGGDMGGGSTPATGM